MLQEQLRLLQHLHGAEQGELAVAHPLLQRRAPFHHQGQKADILRLHGAEGLRRTDGVLPPQLHAAKAGDGRHRQGHTAAPGLLSRRHDGGGAVALPHPLQHRVAAGFQPHVNHLQAPLTQQPQVVLRLHLQAGGRGVARHPLALREQAVDQAQYLHQIVGFPHQRVAVRQKDTLHVAVQLAGHLEILTDLVHRPHGEMLVVVHIAEGAGVVAAPVGHLHDQAVGLRGRTVNFSFVTHGHHSFVHQQCHSEPVRRLAWESVYYRLVYGLPRRFAALCCGIQNFAAAIKPPKF